MDPGIDRDLPPIPAKRYFTIGEVSELCGVKPHVLRYWEQEFEQLKFIGLGLEQWPSTTAEIERPERKLEMKVQREG